MKIMKDTFFVRAYDIFFFLKDSFCHSYLMLWKLLVDSFQADSDFFHFKFWKTGNFGQRFVFKTGFRHS